MKRVALFLSLFFLIALTGTAQIQRKFFGFVLGQTSKAEVSNYCIKNNIEHQRSSDEDGIITFNQKFAGYFWDVVFYKFSDNKLYCVTFINQKKGSIEIDFERLKVSLSEKYEEYLNYNATSEH